MPARHSLHRPKPVAPWFHAEMRAASGGSPKRRGCRKAACGRSRGNAPAHMQSVAFAEPHHHHGCHNRTAYAAGLGRKPEDMAATVSARSASPASADAAPEVLLPDILLDVRTVSKRFGGVRAVEDVSI